MWAIFEPGIWRVSGSAKIDEMAEELGVTLPENPDFDTLGGLVFSQLRSIPKDGTVLDVDVYGLHIHVEKIEDRRIVAALVSKCPQTEEPQEEKDEQ